MITLLTIFNVTTPPSSWSVVLLVLQYFNRYHLNVTIPPSSGRHVLYTTQHLYTSLSQQYYKLQSFISLLLESCGLICLHHTFILLMSRVTIFYATPACHCVPFPSPSTHLFPQYLLIYQSQGMTNFCHCIFYLFTKINIVIHTIAFLLYLGIFVTDVTLVLRSTAISMPFPLLPIKMELMLN